jgi:NADP-dependent 3-hydroxy acid dehydrogenase YdfG
MNRSQEKALKGKEPMNTALAYSPLLKNKHAVIFGASGAIGTAVAKEFAAQMAAVFLSDRAYSDVEQVVNEIT